MVNIVKRMRTLRPKVGDSLAMLFYIRHGGESGVGAATFLPHPAPQITQFDLFVPEQKKAHEPETRKQISGAWSFIRNALPSIKYHNPSLAIRVQTADAPTLGITFESQDRKALQSLDQRDEGAQSMSGRFKYSWSKVQPKTQTAQAGASVDSSEQSYTRQVQADVSDQPHKAIWEYVKFVTKCEAAPEATPEEQTMMKEWKDTLSFGGQDRKRVKAGIDEIRREKEELRKAREAAERMTTE
ncbi:hypothetical protein LTR84_008763 [Exophiala bonariae]|uniref:Ribosomal protein/NADH dehydrogenase domain-containing protein n=1 Tax=Exophiala bonariae TaxID=1690606 RepID=A0AAV9MZA6_9EURO|nr:hypothetical protein LTR84_008763 [Exophiala bonariae]